MTIWPTLPDPRERFVAEVLPVVREICAGDGNRNLSVRYLRVRVMRTHDAVRIAHKDRLDLQRAKLAVPTLGKIVSAGFDLNEGREEKWMHGFVFSCA